MSVGASAAEAPPGGLLIAVEDPEAVYVMARFLAPLGELAMVESVADARARVPEAPVDVVVVDATLHDGGAADVIAATRARYPWAQALVTCTPLEAEDASSLIAAGANDIATKPFDVGALVPRVARLQRSARASRREIEYRQQLESRLRHADRLATLGTLFATVAHEVANPLMAITASADYLQEVLGREALPSASELKMLRKVADEIVAAGGVLTAYVRRIRSFSRRDSEQRVVASLAGTVETAAALLRPRFAERGVVLQRPDTAGPSAPHFPVMYTQALMNALTNAIDAAGRGGHVRVRYLDEGAEVGVAVEDDGPGVDDATIAKMTETFFTTKTDGLGLGMTVMRDAMTAHGGRLDVRRRDDASGLSVRLLVPREAPPRGGVGRGRETG